MYILSFSLFLFLASGANSIAGSTNTSKTERIKKQLQVLEEFQSNLRPEQLKAIQNIRNIIEEAKIETEYLPSYDFEACKREMINNNDGTFTFIIETNKDIQHWMLPVNSNEFNQGMNWHDARMKVKEYELNGIKDWKLPSIEVLYGIHKVNSDCPSKLRKVTNTPIVKGQFYHFAYWTSNEYSFVDSPEKYHADTVSLYTGNVIHERKENIGILWPAKLLNVEPVSNLKDELLRK